MSKFNNESIVGSRFNRLLITSLERVDKHNNKYYNCICDCGAKKVVPLNHLRSGHTKSCSCLTIENTRNNIKHGNSRRINSGTTAEYKAWQNMKIRCYNTKTKVYHLYGGRGIKVCDEWVNDFPKFLEDMGVRPSNKHSLDRFPDMDGNYEKSNCRWATAIEQANNVRKNRWLEYKGERLTATQWCAKFNIWAGSLYSQLNKKSFTEIAEKYSSLPQPQMQ